MVTVQKWKELQSTHTAYLNKTPYVVIRAISDKADGGAQMDYPTFEAKAAENSIKLINCMIKNY